MQALHEDPIRAKTGVYDSSLLDVKGYDRAS